MNAPAPNEAIMEVGNPTANVMKSCRIGESSVALSDMAKVTANVIAKNLIEYPKHHGERNTPTIKALAIVSTHNLAIVFGGLIIFIWPAVDHVLADSAGCGGSPPIPACGHPSAGGDSPS